MIKRCKDLTCQAELCIIGLENGKQIWQCPKCGIKYYENYAIGVVE